MACVLIPTLNEEYGILETIRFIPEEHDIYVIDSESKDSTTDIAREAGAEVVTCKKKGKGNAVRFAFNRIGNYSEYVLIDGDATYPGEGIDRVLEELGKGYDMVIGSRFMGGIENMSVFRNISNSLLTWTFNSLQGTDLTDITSGLRAIKKELIDSIDIETERFEVETEITYKAVSNNFKVSEIPIDYRERKGLSNMKISDMVDIYAYAWKKCLGFE